MTNVHIKLAPSCRYAYLHHVPKTSTFLLTDFNDFGKLNREKILHEYRTDLSTSVRFSCQIFSGFIMPKIINMG